MERNAQDCGISKAAKDTSMLPSKINQMKVSHETGSEANFGFGRALMPFCLVMCHLKAEFFSCGMQPLCLAVSDIVCISPGLFPVCGFPICLALWITFAIDWPDCLWITHSSCLCYTCCCRPMPILWPRLWINRCRWIRTSLISFTLLQSSAKIPSTTTWQAEGA